MIIISTTDAFKKGKGAFDSSRITAIYVSKET